MDDLKQSGNIGIVTPTARNRPAGQHKRQPGAVDEKGRRQGQRKQKKPGSDGHKVDEYV